MIGLAVTQDWQPITHRVFEGNTVDVSTLKQMSKELKRRFGLPEAVLVGDRCMFSAENLEALTADGFRYVACLRSRQRFVGTCRRELLDHLLIFSARHLEG